MNKLIAIISAFLMVACATPKTEVEAQMYESYSKRKEVYELWKKDLDALYRESRNPMLRRVKEFFDAGVAITIPVSGGRLRTIDEKRTDQIKVLVLMPTDQEISGWAAEVNNHRRHAAAGENIILIRHDMLAPRVRANILAHEGFHLLDKDPRLSQEHCDKEARAHRFNIEVFQGIDPTFLKAALKDAFSLAREQRGTELDLVMDRMFGPAQSEAGMNARFTLGILARGLAWELMIGGGEEAIMKRFALRYCQFEK